MEDKDRIEKARGYYYLGSDEDKQMLADIFPELRESEDERIRKFLVKHVSEWIGCIEHDLKISSKDVESEEELAMFKAGLAYLEKQKEPTEELPIRLNGLMQEYVKAGKDEEEQEHRLKCYQLFWNALRDSEFFKQKEQKPDYCHHEVDFSGCSDEYRKAYYDGWNNCNQQHTQLQAEQKSEEDEKMIERLTRILELGSKGFHADYTKEGYAEAYSWLKSLRPQPRWKPSEEQMKALNSIILNGSFTYGGQVQDLISLKDNLKTLK